MNRKIAMNQFNWNIASKCWWCTIDDRKRGKSEREPKREKRRWYRNRYTDSEMIQTWFVGKWKNTSNIVRVTWLFFDSFIRLWLHSLPSFLLRLLWCVTYFLNFSSTGQHFFWLSTDVFRIIRFFLLFNCTLCAVVFLSWYSFAPMHNVNLTLCVRVCVCALESCINQKHRQKNKQPFFAHTCLNLRGDYEKWLWYIWDASHSHTYTHARHPKLGAFPCCLIRTINLLNWNMWNRL